MKKSIFIIASLCLLASCANRESKGDPDTSNMYKITLSRYVVPQPTNPPPPVTPLDPGKTRGVLFLSELQENDLVLTPLDSVGNVRIAVTQADRDVYSSTESFVGRNETIRISTLGWESGNYTLCITYGGVTLTGSFVIGSE